ncbi:bis(5'-nucleosyl)-tetraphosphatase (symmetrical) [Nitrosomonas sp. Nm51]|uniref:symmetrical bis(5'-nucleosyl)-tetraphosphatase n=1 Tax=Nitrosomonas sp. Nm51 TaxID=133720 RepID=UPI0008B12676|nr:symmetrical bis(5'-nucleosyl)-tetraphosphatase [Nitrosomonas sp. Nm51]SEQ76836.1 bis(5'-nucleosyl)-tetraphosphatase (symmetrical) [Nitrosomonas sp. Nm51]
MATYAIGDIQGCYSAFRKLLDLIKFDAGHDRLWLVGDIVNRGPQSLETLRFVKQSGDAVVTVLGNHDLHLLMVDAGIARYNIGDTIQSILDAPDRDELLYWLRHQRLFYVESDYALVHAGLLPDWSIPKAAQLAREVETALRSDDYRYVFAHLYGNTPDYWRDDWTGAERLRVIINAMTRMRICSVDGRMNFSHKGAPKDVPAGFLPWFEIPQRANRDYTIVCGHWSALGLHVTSSVAALDSGCVWNGRLSAMRLEDKRVFQIRCDRLAVTNCG